MGIGGKTGALVCGVYVYGVVRVDGDGDDIWTAGEIGQLCGVHVVWREN